MNKLEKAIDKLIEIKFRLESCWGHCDEEGYDQMTLKLMEDCTSLIKDLQDFKEENDLEFKEMSIRHEL